jgi:predicted RNA-binding protein with TRAM domain
MPGVVPRAQDGSRTGGRPAVPPDVRDLPGDRPGRRRPGAVGGVATQAARGSGSFTVGQEVEVTIEDVAQGGWCVARPAGLPVMFVRHALPGERVVARVSEVTSKFARADAVHVFESSPDRVDAPCPHARPGGCGGCDWQHATLPASAHSRRR